MKTTIEYFIKGLNRQIELGNQKLAKDFAYYFPWVGEDLWMDNFKLKYYQSMLIELETHTAEEVMAHHTKFILDFTGRSYNVRENSSGSLHREVSTWKFQALLNILENLRSIEL